MDFIDVGGEDLSGRQFGELTVIGPVERRIFPSGQRHIYWLCKCHCGGDKIINGGSLRASKSQSCGCHNEELGRVRGRRNVRHGLTRTPEHRVWSSMKSRCSNGNPVYGGRGIRVCDRWMVFENFLQDMGPRPSPQHSLGRKKNDLGYSPDNCRWETKVEQARNQRNNRVVEYDGRVGALASFFPLGVNDPAYNRVHRRLRKGWPIDRAFTAPVNTNLARF